MQKIFISVLHTLFYISYCPKTLQKAVCLQVFFPKLNNPEVFQYFGGEKWQNGRWAGTFHQPSTGLASGRVSNPPPVVGWWGACGNGAGTPNRTCLSSRPRPSPSSFLQLRNENPAGRLASPYVASPPAHLTHSHSPPFTP